MDPGPTILVVDDEPLIIDLIQAALEDGGYFVLTATSGPEAMQALDQDERRAIAGLITDIRLGETDGWAVAHRARARNPSVAVVYVTGDSSHEWDMRGVPKSVVLQKPFAVAQVVVAVTELINAAKGG